MKNITQILTFAFVLGVSLYACDTKKDPAPVVVAPTGFTAAQVAGTWKLTAGSATTVGVPDIFDPAGLAAGSPDGRAAFCDKNSILKLNADGTFTETFDSGAYTFAGTPPIIQNCTARALSGTFVIVATSGALTLTYTGGTTAPRSFVVKAVTATTMTSEISAVVLVTITHTKQ